MVQECYYVTGKKTLDNLAAVEAKTMIGVSMILINKKRCIKMKRLTILAIMISLIAVVSNAEDFNLLENEPSSPAGGGQNFCDFAMWLGAGSLCVGTGLVLGIVAVGDQDQNRLPAVIIGSSLGLGTAMTISLLSSSGLTTNEVISFRVVPVVLGGFAAIVVVPVALSAAVIWVLLHILGIAYF
jgi:hypothetical protein